MPVSKNMSVSKVAIRIETNDRREGLNEDTSSDIDKGALNPELCYIISYLYLLQNHP